MIKFEVSVNFVNGEWFANVFNEEKQEGCVGMGDTRLESLIRLVIQMEDSKWQ